MIFQKNETTFVDEISQSHFYKHYYIWLNVGDIVTIEEAKYKVTEKEFDIDLDETTYKIEKI